MAMPSDADKSATSVSFRCRPIIAAGSGLAVVLAVSIATQTYLSMVGHGHSFQRMLAWQLTTWAFWVCVAPLVLRRGAHFMAGRARGRGGASTLVSLGVALLAAHSVIAAQLTMWIQPFVPVTTYSFVAAWLSQLPARFVIDLLTYGLLLSLGGALWTYRRAQELEVRESRLQAELARAQLHALRLEIEPHFLYNTLNTITALVRLKDNARAVDMLVGLGDFMRSNLDGSHEQFVSLATEVAGVRRYVELQQARFGDRLDVRYEIADACDDEPVPTLLLQPIVENAFRHGLSRKAQGGRLDVCATRRNDVVSITVTDNGAGVPTDFDPGAQVGTGLRNVRSRLDHLYRGAARFEIRPGDGAGTVVSIHLPIQPRREVRATA